MLVERIDEDKDGYVTVEEMKRWIKHAQKRWIYDDVDRQWKSHDLNGDEVVSWEEYKNATYGYILGMAAENLSCIYFYMTAVGLHDFEKIFSCDYFFTDNVIAIWSEILEEIIIFKPLFSFSWKKIKMFMVWYYRVLYQAKMFSLVRRMECVGQDDFTASQNLK